MTVAQAAEKLGVSRQMVLRYIKRKTKPLAARRNIAGEYEIDSSVLARFKPLTNGRPKKGRPVPIRSDSSRPYSR